MKKSIIFFIVSVFLIQAMPCTLSAQETRDPNPAKRIYKDFKKGFGSLNPFKKVSKTTVKQTAEK